MRNTNIRDWIVYVEDNRFKAWDLTSEENTIEVKNVLQALGCDVVASAAFEYELDAIDYGKYLEARKKV